MSGAMPWWRRLKAAVKASLAAVESPHTYALMRIGLGLLLMANVWTIWPHVEYFYGEHGLSPASGACAAGMAQWSMLCHLPAWGPYAFIVGFMAVGLAFTVGLATRVSGVLTVVLFAQLWWRSQVSFAGEHVFADFLLLLCLSRCGEVYSLDRWLARRRGGDEGVVAAPSWPRYLMVLQLMLCLGVNGWAKSGETWRSGEAVFHALANDRFHRFPPWGLFEALGPEGMRWVTWTAWITERGFLLVVLGLVIRPWLRSRGAPAAIVNLADWTVGRRIWASLAVALMLGITGLMNIGWFAPATAVAVLCLFRGDEVARLLRARAMPVRSLPRGRRAMIAAAVFVAWHGWVITTRALVPLVGETVASPMARVMGHYQRLTNTSQFWQMFSPNAPRESWSLGVVAFTADGRQYDVPADAELLAHGQRVKIGYDRRLKVYAMLIKRDGDALRHRHARWVCETWAAPDGARAAEVVLLRLVEPALQFTEWFEQIRADPHPTWDPPREVELLRVSCAVASDVLGDM